MVFCILQDSDNMEFCFGHRQAEPAMHALFPELSVPVAQSESFTRWRQFMLQPDAQLPAFARQYPVNSVPIEEIVVWIGATLLACMHTRVL
jgi:hypothetical protein